ncbi:hypothetical protein [Massilia sp. CF038]|uniref:hypothetical protein n=1 Tax=Massilia sp. CF038 TaxID=1881045 RepID=UPI00091B293C|nr:hypothetical protein [Massilia sp. CF038]SHG41509.1 hypothetical protein SAMN05428948_0363 [Massilia sp. CF038]
MQYKNTIIVTVFVAVSGIALWYDRHHAAPAPVVEKPTPIVVQQVPFSGPRSKSDAVAALMTLPELKAWSAHLEKSSGGASHGAIIEYGPTPKTIGGKRYWQLSYVENTPDAAHRWESFLVGQDNPDILIEDDESGLPMPLEQWRKERNPMARTSALWP